MTTIYENQERINRYYELKTFTFLKEILPSGIERIHNGFVVKLHDDFFLFFDVVKQIEYSLNYDRIIDPTPSEMKEINEFQAKKIMELYYSKLYGGIE